MRHTILPAWVRHLGMPLLFAGLAIGCSSEPPPTEAAEPAADARASETAADAAEDRGAEIRFGPDGLSLAARRGDESVEIALGEGGIVVRGKGDGKRRAPVETCHDLCVLWPAVTTLQAHCATVALETLGYPVTETVACIAAETRAQCQACRRALRLPDDTCRQIDETCLLR